MEDPRPTSSTPHIMSPPFMVGIVETEVDKLTGKVDIIDYVAVVDCGTVVNPNLEEFRQKVE